MLKWLRGNEKITDSVLQLNYEMLNEIHQWSLINYANIIRWLSSIIISIIENNRRPNRHNLVGQPSE